MRMDLLESSPGFVIPSEAIAQCASRMFVEGGICF